MSLAHEPVPLPAPDAWLRTLVAECLGVDEAALSPVVSLRDDLAADSLDLADVAAAIEDDVGLAVPSDALASVRTFGDLLALTDALVAEQARRALEGAALVRTRLSRRGARPALDRVFQLDPYALGVLLGEGAAAAPGTRLEVVVLASTHALVLERVRMRLAPLARRGVTVDVRRAGHAAPLPAARAAG